MQHVAEAGKVLSTVLPMAAALIFAFAMTAAWLFSEWFTKPLLSLIHISPEVTVSVAERNAPGIAEAMRYHSLTITPRGMLSRGVSVLRGKTLIVNLPGSPKAVKENLEYILPSLAPVSYTHLDVYKRQV